MDVMYRVMSSLDFVERILEHYEERVIELATVGYCLVLYSALNEGRLYKYIDENFAL